jgi:hypothetical protein
VCGTRDLKNNLVKICVAEELPGKCNGTISNVILSFLSSGGTSTGADVAIYVCL